MAASKQFLDEVRTDETGAAGHEKRSHQRTNATRSLVMLMRVDWKSVAAGL